MPKIELGNTQIEDLKQRILAAKDILLTTHINPDGDAIGSVLGFKKVLNTLGLNAKAIVPNHMPDFLKWLDAEQDIYVFDEHNAADNESLFSNADLIFCLDYNTLSRVGDMGKAIEAQSCPKVLIDHHQQPDAFDFVISDTETSSTCELLFFVLEQMNWTAEINTEAAYCFYTGIMTDTGSFRYRGTNAYTFKAAGILVDKGVNPGQVNDNINFTSSLDRLKLMGHSISNCLNIVPDKGVAYTFLSEEDLKTHHYRQGDTEGFVNMALSVSEIKVSVFFKQQDGKIKISFRSKGDISVNDFARKYFDGGGHINAAGGVSFASWEETKKKFLNAVHKEF